MEFICKVKCYLVNWLRFTFSVEHATANPVQIKEMSNTCRAVDGLMKDLPLEKLCNFGEMNCTTAGKVAALPHKALDASFGEERATSIARAVRGYTAMSLFRHAARCQQLYQLSGVVHVSCPATLIGSDIVGA